MLFHFYDGEKIWKTLSLNKSRFFSWGLLSRTCVWRTKLSVLMVWIDQAIFPTVKNNETEQNIETIISGHWGTIKCRQKCEKHFPMKNCYRIRLKWWVCSILAYGHFHLVLEAETQALSPMDGKLGCRWWQRSYIFSWRNLEARKHTRIATINSTHIHGDCWIALAGWDRKRLA